MNFKYNHTAQKALEIARTAEGRLPSERELCGICGVSRITARKALEYLRRKGIVTRHVGKGTFLAKGANLPKVTFMMVSPSTPPEIKDHLHREAEIFFGSKDKTPVEFKEIDENVVSAIQGGGTKIVFWPYIGRLSNLGAFACLDELPGFYETCSRIEASYCDWHRGLDGRMRCTAVPMNFNASVFSFNHKFAKNIGLDANAGPQSWDEIIEWGEKCSKAGKIYPTYVPSELRFALPLAYYFTSSGGRDYLEETSSGLRLDFSAGVKWLEFFRRLHSIPGNYKMTSFGPDPLTRRKSLFSCDVGTWILYHRGSKLSSELSVTPIPPVRKGGTSFTQVTKNCMGIVPGGDPAGVEIAWSFVRHLICDTDAQARLADAFPVLSVNRDVLRRQSEQTEWKIFIDAFRSGKSFSSHPIRFGLNALIRECYDDCMRGNLTPVEAAEKIQNVGELLIKIERERTWF